MGGREAFQYLSNANMAAIKKCVTTICNGYGKDSSPRFKIARLEEIAMGVDAISDKI